MAFSVSRKHQYTGGMHRYGMRHGWGFFGTWIGWGSLSSSDRLSIADTLLLMKFDFDFYGCVIGKGGLVCELWIPRYCYVVVHFSDGYIGAVFGEEKHGCLALGEDGTLGIVAS
jgi:hypothetical protein